MIAFPSLPHPSPRSFSPSGSPWYPGNNFHSCCFLSFSSCPSPQGSSDHVLALGPGSRNDDILGRVDHVDTDGDGCERLHRLFPPPFPFLSCPVLSFPPLTSLLQSSPPLPSPPSSNPCCAPSLSLPSPASSLARSLTSGQARSPEPESSGSRPG